MFYNYKNEEEIGVIPQLNLDKNGIKYKFSEEMVFASYKKDLKVINPIKRSFYFLRELKEDVVEYTCFLRVNKKSFLISYYDDSMKAKVLQYQYDGEALKLIGFIRGAGINLAITNNGTLIYSQVTCAKMIENA